MQTTRLTIGVISDTHLVDAAAGTAFVTRLAEGPLGGADLILHAGDIVNPAVLIGFHPRPVHAVRGNMDGSGSPLPTRRIIQAGPFRIGLIHGWGAPEGLERRLLAEFAGESIDALVFGHTHAPLCRHEQGILLFNPGSATDRRGAPSHTVGLLEVGTTLVGRIIDLEDWFVGRGGEA